MTGQQPSRGRPLVALAILAFAWVGLRAAFWQAPSQTSWQEPTIARTGEPGAAPPFAGGIPEGPQSRPGEGLYAFQADPYPYPDYASWGAAPPPRVTYYPYPQGFRDAPSPGAWQAATGFGAQPYGFWGPQSGFAAAPFEPRAAPAEQSGDRPVPVRLAMAHQLMWMAAVSRMPLPMSLFSGDTGSAGLSMADGSAGQSGRRWSADGWLLLRKGGDVSLANGVAPATYGASQAGAVLRYRLDRHSAHRPSAYLRTTAALNGSGEKEAALGVSARPMGRIPVTVAAEVRATDQPGGRRIRPAVLAWTELPPVDLPFGTRGEFYAQGGYVGGRHKTAFADGQLRVDRGVARFGRGEVRAGAGAWAGVQKGASRVDVGPTATMGLPLSNSASARVGVDWRFRLAGNAEPSSGPALTVSAGF